jgi:hypothetical protein
MAGGAVVLERDAVASAAVRDGHVARAHERVQGAVRLQRAATLHHREVGRARQLPSRAHLVRAPSVSRFIHERDTHVLPKLVSYEEHADVTGGKPIAVLLQSISGASANNP